MKINKALIYVLINLLFVQFCAADEKEAELSIPGKLATLKIIF